MAEKKAADNVATEQANSGLQHPQGGVTIRDDATDMGVPMTAGEERPAYPEDALGTEVKRGDYSLRIGPENYQPHEVVPGDNGVVVEAQRERVANQGDPAAQ